MQVANAQNKGEIISGKVIDQYGNPISDVKVAAKGSSFNALTNADGTFKIEYKQGEVLILSHDDYLYKETSVGKIKNLNKTLIITLPNKAIRDSKSVSGPYVSRDKSSFLGSESTIYTDQLTKTQGTTILPALQGRLTGLNLFQYRGARIHQSTSNSSADLIGNIPIFGRGGFSDNSEFNIGSRGVGPVTVVDGVQQELFALDPEAIESISIQKDALSTMFLGMRSSRGALIITTKNPIKDGFQLSFTGRFGAQSSLKTPKALSSYQYAYLLNEALQNDGKEPFYSYDDFAKFRNNSSPFTHPDVNWNDQILDKSSTIQSYNLNVSGGNKFAQYFVSLGYTGEDGIFKQAPHNDYKTKLTLDRYLIQSKINVNITKDFLASLTLIGRIEEGNQPGGSNTGYSDILASVYNTPNSAYPIKNPNGSWGGNVSFTNNLMSQSQYSGYLIDNARDILGTVNLKYDFNRVVKGLSARAVGSIASQNRSLTKRTKRNSVYEYGFNQDGNETYSMFGNTTTQTNEFKAISTYQQMYGQVSVDYERTFDAHHFKASLMGDTKSVLIDYDLPSLPSNIIADLSYDYKGKYFAQAAISESYYNRYAPNKRWGTFYAFGLGWEISKENFLKDIEWVDKLKLRGVYGNTGNGIDNTGYYTYRQSFSESGVSWYPMGTSQSNFATIYEKSPLANPNLTWEKAHKINVGIDLALLQNRLWFTADYYNDKYYDLLQNRGKNIELIGQTYPLENIGKGRRQGVELSFTWQDHISDFNYYVTANWSLEHSKILFMDEQQQPEEYLYQTGRPIGAVFGLVADGFFTSDEEIAKSPVIAGFDNIKPGDVKYKDLNNDGVINEFDRTVIGGDKPLSTFGIDLGFNWKGLEFSMLWQGAYNRDQYMSDWVLMEGFQANNQHYGQAYENIQNRWTPETAETATLPRLTAGGSNYNRGNNWGSSFWVKSGDFIRLKNISLAYTIPEAFCRQYIGGLKVKVFVNGQNLFTQSAYSLVDPEVSFTSYPLQRCVSTGINIKF